MIDVVLLGIIGISGLFGIFQGFTRMVVKTAAWIIAAWAAFEFGGIVALHLSDDSVPSATQTFGGYALMFVVTWVAIGIIGAMLRTGVEAASLTGMDRFLGLILGFIRGVCLCSLLVLVMSFTALTSEASWHQSQTMAYIMPLTNWMRSQLANWKLLKSSTLASATPTEQELGHVYGQLLRKELGHVAQTIVKDTQGSTDKGVADSEKDAAAHAPKATAAPHPPDHPPSSDEQKPKK